MPPCERCKTENTEGSQYCDECGAPLRLPSPRRGTGQSFGGNDRKGLAEASRSPRTKVQAEFSANKPAQIFAVSAAGAVPMTGNAHSTIVIERGGSAGKEFLLVGDESQIGRWDADGGVFPDVDLDADDPEAKVSRRHARIIRRNGEYFIEDLGSTNGTFINRGRRLLPGDSQALRDGDEIIVGKTFLRFRMVR